jgi:hypothetical protein
LGVISESLRLQQRVDQVPKQKQRGNTSNDVVHGSPSKAIAGLGEDPGDGEEGRADQEVEEIQHYIFSLAARP